MANPDREWRKQRTRVRHGPAEDGRRVTELSPLSQVEAGGDEPRGRRAVGDDTPGAVRH